MAPARRTKLVKALLNEFCDSSAAISVTDLLERLNSLMNKTSVYRILERLEGDGTLHSFVGKDGLRWYAMSKPCSASDHIHSHPHFQCKECGRTECLELDLPIPAISNHKIESAELLLVGKCEKCCS